LRLVVGADGRIDAAAAAPAPLAGRIVLRESGRVLIDERVELRPGRPWKNTAHTLRAPAAEAGALELILDDANGNRVLDYQNGVWPVVIYKPLGVI
jgi:hypothetical protein